MKTRDLDELREKACIVRENILETIGINKKGHVGGSMSAADLVTALYFYKMNLNPDNPEDPDRDRFIFSKGHSVLAQYAALSELGYFPKSELKKCKTLGSILQGHPERETPGIEANTGSLGQGLSVGVGMALGAKLDNRVFKIYVILGDGELGEGQVWEAVTAASAYQLDNLIAIVDHNKLQATGPIKVRLDLGNIKEKFAAFGWNTFEVNGHDLDEITNALDEVDGIKDSPSVIIANTIKGKGVSFAENIPGYHNAPLTAEQLQQAQIDIRNT